MNWLIPAHRSHAFATAALARRPTRRPRWETYPHAQRESVHAQRRIAPPQLSAFDSIQQSVPQASSAWGRCRPPTICRDGQHRLAVPASSFPEEAWARWPALYRKEEQEPQGGDSSVRLCTRQDPQNKVTKRDHTTLANGAGGRHGVS